jgi:hypothetical protein
LINGEKIQCHMVNFTLAGASAYCIQFFCFSISVGSRVNRAAGIRARATGCAINSPFVPFEKRPAAKQHVRGTPTGRVLHLHIRTPSYEGDPHFIFMFMDGNVSTFFALHPASIKKNYWPASGCEPRNLPKDVQNFSALQTLAAAELGESGHPSWIISLLKRDLAAFQRACTPRTLLT